MEAGDLRWGYSIHCGPAFQRRLSNNSCNVRQKGKHSSIDSNSAMLLLKIDSINSLAYVEKRDM
jgi:hypothetical protein